MLLTLRVDATDEVGAGHGMRCATLAQAWMEGGYGEAAYRGAVEIPFVRKRFAEIGIAETRGMSSADSGVLVVDSYSPQVRSDALAQNASRVSVAVDDVGGPVDGYDVVWNPNAYTAGHLYRGFTGRLIEQLVPIRAGLPRWRGERGWVGVSLGGTPPRSELIGAIDKWASSLGHRVRAGKAAWLPANWTPIDPVHVWEELAGCQMLIASAGTTVWEAAAVGIPACVVVTASNQELVARWARERDATVIDVRSAGEEEISAALRSAPAKPLPRVENGAPAVCRLLHGYAA